ncbi:MAG: hypothetical protein HW411_584 [Gammaproteobacteria bacterium]|nr:hypothetical protein [Gammaproteobacteria bacterium]
MGKTIGGLTFIGGCLIIRSLFSPSPNVYYLATGSLFLIAALVLFLKELKKI